MYFLNDFEFLINQLICTYIYLTMLFYLFHYMIVRYGALKMVKLLKNYVMISSDNCWFEKKYPNMYVTCKIGTTSNTNQYQFTNDRFLVFNC